MAKPVRFQEMLDDLRRRLKTIPEHRRGRNIQYKIEDAGLAAFSVFYLQSPSFLAYQQQMQEREGRDNARSLFGIRDIPSDGQIRSLLDPVEPHLLGESFWDIYDRLRANGHLESYRHVGGTLLCSMDGTRYFASKKIHCDNCTVYERQDQTDYAHMAVVAILSGLGSGS